MYSFVAMASAGAVLEFLRSVEEPDLDLYVAVFGDDRGLVDSTGVVKARQVSGSKNYIGLRESPEDALERGKQVYKGIEGVKDRWWCFALHFPMQVLVISPKDALAQIMHSFLCCTNVCILMIRTTGKCGTVEKILPFLSKPLRSYINY